mmetsp:Transcript_804/g.1530  ORF Transcript_804/g.1530 Transcript_804/m.1530 type:complete len:294 (-) Transcript_804:122-1003(-)
MSGAGRRFVEQLGSNVEQRLNTVRETGPQDSVTRQSCGRRDCESSCENRARESDQHGERKTRTYVLKRKREFWTPGECQIFQEGLAMHGRNWKKIQKDLGMAKSLDQIRSHAQKYFKRQRRLSSQQSFMQDTTTWHPDTAVKLLSSASSALRCTPNGPETHVENSRFRAETNSNPWDVARLASRHDQRTHNGTYSRTVSQQATAVHPDFHRIHQRPGLPPIRDLFGVCDARESEPKTRTSPRALPPITTLDALGFKRQVPSHDENSRLKPIEGPIQLPALEFRSINSENTPTL